MFLHLMNDAQKQEFLKLGRRMIAANEVSLDLEKAYLYRLLREAGIRAHERTAERDAVADSAVFDSRRARVAAAVELLVIALLDGEFDAGEQAVADDVMAQFEIDPADRADVRAAADHLVTAMRVVTKMVA
ncbi:MAG: hypothetical protein VW405_16760 [Rhodospirillaceae bacterium]